MKNKEYFEIYDKIQNRILGRIRVAFYFHGVAALSGLLLVLSQSENNRLLIGSSLSGILLGAFFISWCGNIIKGRKAVKLLKSLSGENTQDSEKGYLALNQLFDKHD